jgi:hypothetical protein
LQAITKQELQVPANITKMEAEMKKEYAASIRKAKLAVKAEGSATGSSAARRARSGRRRMSLVRRVPRSPSRLMA